MKLFRFTMGLIEKYGVFADATEAYDRRDTLDVQFDYLPVEIEEVKVEGYEITLTPINDDPFQGWNKAKYREYLDENGLAYTAQWGEARLRELVTYHMNPPAADVTPADVMREYGLYADGRVVDVNDRFQEIRKEREYLDHKDIRSILQDELGVVYTIAAANEEEAKVVAPEILKELSY